MRRCMTRWTSPDSSQTRYLPRRSSRSTRRPRDRVGDLARAARASHQRGSSTSISSSTAPLDDRRELAANRLDLGQLGHAPRLEGREQRLGTEWLQGMRDLAAYGRPNHATLELGLLPSGPFVRETARPAGPRARRSATEARSPPRPPAARPRAARRGRRRWRAGGRTRACGRFPGGRGRSRGRLSARAGRPGASPRASARPRRRSRAARRGSPPCPCGGRTPGRCRRGS